MVVYICRNYIPIYVRLCLSLFIVSFDKSTVLYYKTTNYLSLWCIVYDAPLSPSTIVCRIFDYMPNRHELTVISVYCELLVRYVIQSTRIECDLSLLWITCSLCDTIYVLLFSVKLTASMSISCLWLHDYRNDYFVKRKWVGISFQ